MASKTNTMKGGFWNTPQAQYSQQTQCLLKEMMNESKLTNFQQRHLEKSMRGGSSLPTQCAPTSSARPKIQKQPKKQSKILNPRNYSGGVRSKDTMEALGAFEKPDYRLPKNNGRSVREKEKLANIMAFGEDVDNRTNIKMKQAIEVPVEMVKVDRFQELQNEITDRKHFLQDMIKLGKGNDYKQVIDTEISQMVREMELIDKTRLRELDYLIHSQETKTDSS